MAIYRRRSKAEVELRNTLADVYGKELVHSKEPGFAGLLSFIRAPRQSTSTRGTSELLEAYSTSPWVRSVVAKIAEGVASTEWVALRAKGQTPRDAARVARSYMRASPPRRKAIRKAAEFEELPGHPILDTMDQGNWFHAGYVLAELTQVHQELVGESFWLKERNGRGEPVELWNLPPSWIVGRPIPGTPIETFTVRVDGEMVPIPMSEIVWFQKPSALRPYDQGVGVGHTLGDEIDVDEYTAKMMKSFLINGAVPDLLITADGLSPENTQRLEQDWLNKTQGFWRRFRPYFMGKKVEVTKLTTSFRDLQLDKIRTHERDMIVHTWGVSPEILGILENSNRATIEGAFFQFARWVLVPRLEFKRVVLQNRLVPDFRDPSIVLDYVSPVEEDREHVLKVMSAMPAAFTIDEWREEAGREELDGKAGDVFPKPPTLTFIPEHVPSSGEEPPPEPAPPPTPEPDEDEKAARRMAELREGGPFTKECDPIRTARDAIDPQLIDDALRPMLREIVTLCGEAALDSVGLEGADFDLTAPEVVDYLAHGYAEEYRMASDTTKNELERAIAALGDDPSKASVISTVRSVFERAREVRAPMIARTATVQPANFGTFAGLKQAGIAFKDWVSQRDPRVRHTHDELDEQPPIPMDELFVSSNQGFAAPYPGAFGVAEEDINCRCYIVAAGADADGLALRLYDGEEKRTEAWKVVEGSREPFEALAMDELDHVFDTQEAAVIAAIRRC